jgi:sterol desaturase/sphingolipid hydroxylase (fatty acid hydroxylase superfamily)
MLDDFLLMIEQWRPVIGWIYWNVIAPLLDPRYAWWLLGASFLAGFVYLRLVRRDGAVQAMRYIADRGVWLHRSALLDYRFYLINQLLVVHLRLGALVVGLVGLLDLSRRTESWLVLLFGERLPAQPTAWSFALMTVGSFLAMDFARFFAHWLLHKVPALWQFHKVHHAAELLNPVTAARAHPVETMLDLFMRLLFAAPVTGVFRYVWPSITEVQILGYNAVALFVFVLWHHLQHSHVGVHFGPAVARWWMTPFMHHVHHSAERRHWDKNMGFGLSVWDRLFGTLYVPERDESFRMGLPPSAGRFDSVGRLYLEPFVQLARGGWRTRNTAADQT